MTSALSMQIAHSLWAWMNGEAPSTPPSSPPQQYSSSPSFSPSLSSTTSSPSASPSLSLAGSPRSAFRSFRPRRTSTASTSSIPSIKVMSPEEVDLETRPLMDSKVRVQQGRRVGRRTGSRSPPTLHRRWGSSDDEGEGVGLGLGLGMGKYRRLA